MFNPFRRAVPRCPECGRPPRIGRDGKCLGCGERIYVPIAYFRWLWFLVFVTLVALAIPTFNGDHSGTWLLVLLVLAVPIRVIWGIIIPPWIERGAFKSEVPFIAFYGASCLMGIIYWTLWGWLHVGLGATKDELKDNWDIFSVPLGWIHPGFVIRSDKWLSDVFGTIMGNSFFGAVAIFFVYRVVRTRLNQNRAIRLDIADPNSKDGE
jgi:hypothetical protein